MIVNKKTIAALIFVVVLSMFFTGFQWQLEKAQDFLMHPEWGDFNWIFTCWKLNAWAARDFFMMLMDVCWIILCCMLFYYMFKARDKVITQQKIGCLKSE